MIRLLLVLTGFLTLTSLAALLANLPGMVTIALPGYQLQASLPVLAGLFFAALILVTGFIFIVSALWQWPAHMRAKRAAQNRQAAEQAMAGGLMALARGDSAAAVEATRQARRKLPQAALPRLLAAQAALMDDRPDDAAANYHAMLSENMPMTQKSLGLEGLYHLARSKGDVEAAGTYALQVLEVDQKALWALEGLTALSVQIGDWQAAENWLRRCGRAGVPRAQVKQHRAVLALAEAQDLLGDSDPAAQLAASERAEKAAALDAKLVPAVAMAARLQMRNGKPKQAQKLLKQAWRKTPHQVLAEAWLECNADQPVAGRMRAAGQFIGRHKAHEEAILLRARIALAAARFRQAAALLNDLLADLPTPEAPPQRFCMLMAEAETGLENETAAQEWRARARQAPPPPGWYGDGIRLADWQAICPASGRLGGVSWRSPPTGMMLVPNA